MRHGWSLERATWTQLREGLSGRSWYERRFDKKSAVSVPDGPGAYMIVAVSPIRNPSTISELRTPLYVGSTINIRKRFREHAAYKGHLKAIFPQTLFCFTRTANIDKAKALEGRLASAFGPPDNRIKPPKITATVGLSVPI